MLEAPVREEALSGPAAAPSPPRSLRWVSFCTAAASRASDFFFPELGCLRRHLAFSAKPKQSVQLESVIYLRAWPVLPGARRAIHFRSSRWL